MWFRRICTCGEKKRKHEGSQMPKVFGRKKVAEPAPRSHWPVWLHMLFETLRDIPWLPLTAIGTFVGVLLLSLYFQSIDYFPSDISTLIGLGVATAVCALGLYGAMALGLLAPAVMYRQYRNGEKEALKKADREFHWLELVGLQLGSVGLLFGSIAKSDYRNCGNLLTGYSVITALCLFFCLMAFARIVGARGTMGQRLERFSSCVGITVFSAPAVVIFAFLLPVFKATYFDFSYVFFVLWTSAILVNAWLAERFRVIGLVAVGALVVWIAFIALPALVGKASLFPQMVASTLGVRQDRVQEFRVPNKTCLLIQSGLGGSNTPSVDCSSGDWSTIKMQVLSNVGEQWFVEIQANTEQHSAGSALRMSIPKTDVHLVQSPESRKAKHVTVTCEK